MPFLPEPSIDVVVGAIVVVVTIDVVVFVGVVVVIENSQMK